jgi:integrase
MLLEHVALPAISHCFRRDAVYYWRRWTPGPRRTLVQLSLAVKDARTARTLSSVLTARSEELFPLWSAGQMNKSQLLQYLHECLATGRRRSSSDGFSDLAQALSLRMLATRGFDAKLSAADRVALERQWGQPELVNSVVHAMAQTKRHPPDVETFVDQSIAASLSVGREPTGEDAEQAARVRLLAAASLALQSARELSVADIGVGQIIAEIANGQGLPETSGLSEPLDRWLDRTIKHLRDHNPYAEESGEDLGGFQTVLDDVQPTLLAEWIRQGGPPKGSTEPDHQHLEQQIEALRDALATIPERVEAMKAKSVAGIATSKPIARQSTPLGPVASTPTTESALITAVAEKLVVKQQQRNKWDDKTARQANWTYFIFPKVMLEEHGVTRFSELRQSHVEHFDDFLLAIYSSFGRGGRDREKSIAEVRALAKSKGAKGLDIVTRSRHMRFLSALFEAARASEDLDPRLDPTAFTGKKTVRPRDERATPKSDQMAAFFHAPVFVGCESFEKLDLPGPHIFHRAAYFAPMLAHYQGMRREEYCGLTVDDIVVDNGDIPYIHVCFNQFRRLKNAQSVRNLSLHPELIRLGFLDYIERLRALGIERLFPDLYSPSSRSPLGDRLYDELEPIRTRLGITLHQFRHFFNNELKQKRVSHEFREDMMGHRGRSETTERYCDPVLIELQREDLAKIELRTAHLEPRPIKLIPWVEARLTPPWSRPGRAKSR